MTQEEIYQQLDKRFVPIVSVRHDDPELETDLDSELWEISKEWDASLSVIQTTYQKLLVKMKEDCAKAVCPMCKAGDIRFERNGHEVHAVKVAQYKDDFGRSVEASTTAVVRCAANSIWSMK